MAENTSKTEQESKAPANKVSYPRLEVIAGPQEGMIFHLTQGEHILGRARQNVSIFLEDTSASRVHTKIFSDQGGLTIQDLRSRNGTYVNGVLLNPNEEKKLNHLDQIKIGIYFFRLTTRSLTPEEESRPLIITHSSHNPVRKDGDKNQEAQKEEGVKKISEKIGEKTTEEKIEQLLESEETKEDKKESEENEEKGDVLSIVEPLEKTEAEESIGMRLGVVFIIICILCGLAGLTYYYFSYRQQGKPVESQKEEIIDETSDNSHEIIADEKPPEEDKVEIKDEGEVLPIPKEEILSVEMKETTENVVDTQTTRPFHAFLDIQTKPTTATLFFNGERLGQAPLKSHVELKPGEEYEVVAEFDLPDIHDKYQQRKKFKADVREEVVSLMFDADIGVLKILRLPRGIDFYMEGYYAYDKEKAHPVKLTDIIYGKPIYVPFGDYNIELRERVRVGQSDTFVKEIRYQREFSINEERRVTELSIEDRDLQFFPARIQSVPSGAVIFVDEEEVGTTPFRGDLPLGRHNLKLVREGYFNSESELEMRLNTPYEAVIQLKTSKVGELINKAREYRQSGQFSESINELVEALKLGGSDREKAQIYYYLGDAYFMLGDTNRATTYFEQARNHQDFYYNGILGLARVYHSTGNREKSFSLLVEIFLNVSDKDPLKGEAKSLFKQLSPLKSVLYVSSEPKGAEVFLNGSKVNQKTPVLLLDLSLGHYRVEIQKTGYQSVQIKKNLKLGEFVPVFITLNPEKI